MLKHKLLTTAIALAAISPVFAQDEIQKDSVPNTKEVKNRNVMLNASADNQPRQINIGLPAEMSATIYENGSPTSWTWWPMLPYFYWAAGPHYSKVGMSSLSENAITNGAINYVIDCWSRTGGDKFQGFADYTTNSHGLQRFDLDISGPIAKGWSYNIGAYINHDRGNNHLADVDLQQNMKQFHAALTKTFNNNKGQMSLLYKYSSLTDRSDGNGPFYFNADGSVDEMEDFDLGKDGYIPADQRITYMDMRTGEMRRIPRKSYAMSQDVTYTLDYNFNPRLTLSFNSKYHFAKVNYVGMTLAGIGTADATSGYTYAAPDGDHNTGDVFTGNYQVRYGSIQHGIERAWYNNAELKGKSANNAHNWRVGANIWWILPEVDNSNALFTHTVEKDPVWLNLGGNQSFGFNSGAEYYNMNELKTALYASDDWQVNKRLWLSAGVRLEYYKLGGRNVRAYSDAAGNDVEIANNVRTTGWTLRNATFTPQDHKFFNPAVAFSGRYTIAKGFGALFEGIYTKQAPGSPNFAGPTNVNTDAINTYFGTAGLFWNTPWMKLVSQFSYIKKTNYQRNTQFTNPNDANDVQTVATTYAVQTLGWTTDVVLTPFKGFNFHGLLTLQSPKFKDFSFANPFESGATFDFSDNYTTGVSKTIIELDPSYMFSKFRVWASFRYQSKQYINRTNSLYFKGRWETFAGVDYNLNQHISFGLQLINLLNQKGASGSIQSADLVTETSAFNHYLMSGSYIRPFTVELSAHINF